MPVYTVEKIYGSKWVYSEKAANYREAKTRVQSITNGRILVNGHVVALKTTVDYYEFTPEKEHENLSRQPLKGFDVLR